MRLRFDKTAEERIKKSPYYINPTVYPIDLDNHCVVEVGMGKGEMIVELARLHPELKFYGLEKYWTVAAKTLKKAQEYNLQNFFLVIDGAVNLSTIFSGKLNTLWLTFSDPWPKARHERRRLTHKNFLSLYQTLMSDDSLFKFKSDNEKLYHFSLESLQANGWKILANGTDLHNSAYAKDNIMTGYEQKWSALGTSIKYIFARRPKI
ncbi:tRNA (guanosine(46)-N7)-methyltransferase TrmB [Mycoplasmopsis columbinasalis]|uniref:tRNA (guanine-N(7)-)-methyltransferase n=1 Tax=Mycoplasmopsis columbinasalis TaxID=114880 RepID=A0A449BAG8_9BACT|nr:tRNA (guanosine(46)-N7)-methyltransferase TrmB [Mycoplasmopsis columbinasalis]VEU78193.1 tRNA (guanine-N(7)-)-methyltransferase [Mycoplasmopsis columbinasalis]